MRKVAVWGFVVVAVALLFTGAQAQRIALSPTAAPVKPQQVEVTNFPAVQSVNGAVDVGNLPLDADGNVRVSPDPAGGVRPIRFVGFSQATFQVNSIYQGPLPLGRACDGEFPGSRICEVNEIVRSVPMVPAFSAPVWVFVPQDAADLHARTVCVNPEGVVGSCGGELLAVACCGF